MMEMLWEMKLEAMTLLWKEMRRAGHRVGCGVGVGGSRIQECEVVSAMGWIFHERLNASE